MIVFVDNGDQQWHEDAFDLKIHLLDIKNPTVSEVAIASNEYIALQKHTYP